MPGIHGLQLLLVLVAAVSSAADPSKNNSSRASTALSAQVPTPSAPAKAAREVLPLLPCGSIRCSQELEPVCGIGKGVAGCSTPDKGCTYTNKCMAQCVYDIRVVYAGACTDKDSMQIVEHSLQGSGSSKSSGSGSGSGCQGCGYNFAPVCATLPACKVPGGCTYANECFAHCYGAKVIKQGAC